MNCKQASQLISLTYEKRLPLPQKMKLSAHLLICTHCRAFQKNSAFLNKLMKDYGQEY